MHVLDPSEQRTSEPAVSPDDRAAAERPPLALQPGAQFRSLLTMVSAVEVTLVDALTHVAELAAEGLPAADGVCVSVERTDGRGERVTTTDAAAELPAMEDQLGEGPGVDAVARGRAVRSDDLAADPRWPALAAAVTGGTLRSVLVLPLLGPTAVLGTLTLYASARSAFDDRTRQLGVRLAASAARTVRHALVLDRARRLTTQRHLHGPDRTAVDQAIAVLMTENGVASEQAYAVLQLLGRTEHDDLVEVARAIVAAEDVPPPVSPRG